MEKGMVEDFRGKYVNHSKCQEVSLKRRRESTSQLSSLFCLVTTPEYLSAAGHLLFRMSLNKIFPITTHTVHTCTQWFWFMCTTLFQKHCISKAFSSGWIRNQMCRKSRTQISGLKIGYSALWLWRGYLRALNLPFGHHGKDYTTSQDLFVYANHHLIGQPSPSPRLNI